MQNEVRIQNSIKDKSFFRNPAFLMAIKNVKKHKSSLHIMGLVQNKGVHAMDRHLYALLKLCKMHKIKPLIHVFTDGRDSEPHSAAGYIKKLEPKVKACGGRIVTLIGRYFSMDRDHRWDRTKKAYGAIMNAKGYKAKNWRQALKHAYEDDKKGDEFVKPCIIAGYSGIKKNDSIINFNYRSDRVRQITKALVEKDFKFFKRKYIRLFYTGFSEYYKGMNALIAFPEKKIPNILAKVIAVNKMKQLRAAETEKYAHVTFFFNAEIEKPFPGEDRILIPSPKVATYDLQPEMSANKVMNAVLKSLKKNKYDFVIINFANCDMVGHTGVFKAALKAVETVDYCVGKVIQQTLKQNGYVLIIADHGNAEEMTGKHQTSHTLNKVPCCLIGTKYKKLKPGRLADVAPTMLFLKGIKIPKQMNGNVLVVR